MRVLSVAPLPPLRDGIATYTAALAGAYRQAGHHTGFVATDPGATAAGDLVAVLTANPVTALRAARAARAWRPDRVHVQHAIATYGPALPALLLFLWLLRRDRAEVLITHHEVTRDTDRLGLPGRWYYRLVTALAGAVHVHTHAARDRLRQCAPGADVVVHPHPVFLPEDAAPRPQRQLTPDVTALLIGYIQTEKGHLEAVRALAAALTARPDLRGRLRLVIAGEVRRRPPGLRHFEKADRDYEQQVHDEIRRLGLDDDVSWTGHVPEHEFAGWFSRADVVLLPYRTSEESGIAGHAIAAGTPVLATRTGGLGVLFGGTRWALPGTGPEEFGHALTGIADDPAQARTRAEADYAAILRRRSPDSLIQALTPARHNPAAPSLRSSR